MNAVAWAREKEAPDSVRTAAEPYLAGDQGAVHEILARGGLAALADVVREPSNRSHAFTLLAADALLTWACEAALEEGIAELERLTGAMTLDRFEALEPETR